MRHFKLLNLRILSLFLFFLAPALSSKATHVIGAEISYKWISGNTFRVELSVFRDCGSLVTLQPTQKIFFSSFTCRPTQDSVIMVLSGPPQDVSPLCKREPSNCKGGTSPGVQRFRFSGNVTLAARCADWVFYYRECNRSATIGTLLTPQNSCLYVEARLNNLLAPENSSPQIGNDPISYLCVGQPVDINPGATDVNGDALKFELVTPRTNSIIPNTADLNIVRFKPGYSASTPMPAQNGVVFDPTTGQISFTPSQQIIGVTAMKISEFRNGKLIGSIMQDIQLLSRDCENATPTLSGFGNGTEYEQLLCVGDTLRTQFTALDGNGNDSLKIRWNKGLAGAVFKADSGIALTRASISWVPTVADTGFKTFTITTFDDHCPSIGSSTRSYKLRVRLKPRISTLGDTVIPCGVTIPISAIVMAGQAPFSYSWPGRSETTQIITVWHGIYTARVHDATGCFAEDTIKVKGSSITGVVQVDTACLVEGVQLTALTSSSNPNLTYTCEWTFPPEVQVYTGMTIRRTFPTSGIKNVLLKVASSDNCKLSVPTTIKVCDPPPVYFQYAPDVCIGQEYRIGCGLPGLDPPCGAATICVLLTGRNWLMYPPTGFVVLPPDSLRPDSNSFEIITTSANHCTNKKNFKFKVRGAPKIKLFPDVASLRFNCNRPDTTLLIKIYKDDRFLTDSLWGNIKFLDSTIILPRTIEDTIYHTLHLSEQCIVNINAMMSSNCMDFKSLSYMPQANPRATISKYCKESDLVTITTNLPSTVYENYVIDLGNGTQTQDTANTIYYPPNQIYHGYFAVEDTFGCLDTARFTINTIAPDTTILLSDDSLCFGLPISLTVLDTGIVRLWTFFNTTEDTLRFLPGVKQGVLPLELEGFNTITTVIKYKNDCISTWDLPVYVRPRIRPTTTVSNVCAVDSSYFNGGIAFSLNPIKSWRWNYESPPHVTLPFSEDTIQNPVHLFKFNGKLRSILTVEDIIGCVGKDTLDTNMVLISLPQFDVNGNCQNDSLIFFFGRVPDEFENIEKFTYIYNDGTFESTSNGQGLHQFAEPGIYKIKLIAYSVEGCTNRDSTTLNIKPRPKADFNLPPPEFCEGQVIAVDGRNSKPAQPGDRITSYVWATSEANPFSTDTTTTITLPPTGVTFIALQVKSTNGCQDYLKRTFIARPRPVPAFVANEEDLLKGDLISFDDQSVGGTIWRWDYGDGNRETFTDSALSSPIHKYTYGSAFTVKQWVANPFGCADSLSKPVNLKSYIALPKAFSPNGDERNDGCGLLHRYIKKLEEFKIYNRLGQVVFDGGNNLDSRWNGKLEGVNQPNGNYIYTARATSVFGENLELRGSITLIR